MPFSQTLIQQACMFRCASLSIGTFFTVAVFTIFATSNVDLVVGIPHKMYTMQRILIHIKADLFVNCAHLHPGYAANLVAISRYYHCHWSVLLGNCTSYIIWIGVSSIGIHTIDIECPYLFVQGFKSNLLVFLTFIVTTNISETLCLPSHMCTHTFILPLFSGKMHII